MQAHRASLLHFLEDPDRVAEEDSYAYFEDVPEIERVVEEAINNYFVAIRQKKTAPGWTEQPTIFLEAHGAVEY